MFSVIIPLYNKEKFVKRAIDSVLNQSSQDFEIIIINDGSTDSSLEVIKSINSDKLIIHNQDNKGVSVARNKGAELAKYDYLAFLDADDVWDKNFLKKMEELIDSYPDAGIYGSNNYFLYPNGVKKKNELKGYFLTHEMGIMEDYFGLFADLQRSPFSNSNLVIPKKIFTEMGGYKVGVKLTEDSDLWCRIALKYDVAYNKKPLSTYYLAQEGSTHSVFENKQSEVTKMLSLALAENGVPNDKIASVKKLIALQKLGLIKRGILTHNRKEVYINLFDVSIVTNYPKEYIKCAIAMLIPSSLFEAIR